MIILGLDPSKTSGWAYYDTEARVILKCGLLRVPPKTAHYETIEVMAELFRGMLAANGKPDMAVIEEAMLQTGNSADALIYAWQAATVAVSDLTEQSIPYGTLPVQTWRARVFKGRTLPELPMGKDEPPRKRPKPDYKRAAVMLCDEWGVTLPTPASLAHNAAEACLMAVCWTSAKFHTEAAGQAFVKARMTARAA